MLVIHFFILVTGPIVQDGDHPFPIDNFFCLYLLLSAVLVLMTKCGGQGGHVKNWDVPVLPFSRTCAF